MPSANKTPLGLNQWQANEYPKMADFNEDNRIIDEKITALQSGSGVKIYTVEELTDPAEGKIYNVKIEENTSTINEKPVYKENTSESVTLKAGKVATVYFSGGNFFYKANASGDAIAEHVLAGKTFSNDLGTDINGSMDLRKVVNILKGLKYDNRLDNPDKFKEVFSSNIYDENNMPYLNIYKKIYDVFKFSSNYSVIDLPDSNNVVAESVTFRVVTNGYFSPFYYFGLLASNIPDSSNYYVKYKNCFLLSTNVITFDIYNGISLPFHTDSNFIFSDEYAGFCLIEEEMVPTIIKRFKNRDFKKEDYTYIKNLFRQKVSEYSNIQYDGWAKTDYGGKKYFNFNDDRRIQKGKKFRILHKTFAANTSSLLPKDLGVYSSKVGFRIRGGV